MESCLKDIVNWMSINKLKLNTEKTELLDVNSRHQAQTVFTTLAFGSDIISPSDSVRNIGVIFDRTLSMSPHINNVCKSSTEHCTYKKIFILKINRNACSRIYHLQIGLLQFPDR